MEFQLKYITPEIKLSNYEDKLFKSEVLFDHHMLVWFISGETKIIQADAEYLFGPGDIFMIPRNHLATIINYPKDGQPHKSVVMHLEVDRLRKFYAGLDIKSKAPGKLKVHRFPDHPLLKSCFTSLLPYFDMQDNFPENIADLKINEAISVLRLIDPGIDQVLSNFDEPGKVDLVTFMEKNFMFNMPMEKFGYLTGRSLATFNRDFRKHFTSPPQKWLTQKRLELAHYQLTQKNKKPAEVYLEVGFEDLSHFSFAFKKQFGLAPTELIGQRPVNRAL